MLTFSNSEKKQPHSNSCWQTLALTTGSPLLGEKHQHIKIDYRCYCSCRYETLLLLLMMYHLSQPCRMYHEMESFFWFGQIKIADMRAILFAMYALVVQYLHRKAASCTCNNFYTCNKFFWVTYVIDTYIYVNCFLLHQYIKICIMYVCLVRNAISATCSI